MPLDILGLGLSLLLSASHAAGDVSPITTWPQRVFTSVVNFKMDPPAFRSADRAVTNWRREALWNLVLFPKGILQLGLGKDPAGTSRCVKLNNYWCIKKAGWNGEIAADGEGHVGFASALEGATVAALLLRRYYIDYNRRSAFSIISHWAPAQCGSPLLASRPRVLRVTNAASRAVARADAPRGIQNTLRARWLAGHTRGGVQTSARVAPLRRSVIADPLLKMMPAPEIAVGSGERDAKSKPFTLATLGTLSLSNGTLLPPITSWSPITSCAGDGPRIQAYALHAAAGVAPNASADLHLFTDDGVPTENLARVMSNMAAVEIGPLSVRNWLVDAGIAALVRRGEVQPPKENRASAVQP